MTRKHTLIALLCCGAMAAQAAPISKAEARQIAQEFIGIDDSTTDEVAIAPYYVFSRGAGKGYVIVSGDDTTTPIIGYTEQGDFAEDRLIEPMKVMLDGWAERISTVQARKVQGPRRTPAQRIAEARMGIAAYKANWKDIPALVKTHWHQSSPYNDMAPVMDNGGRCATGCVATAGSQVAYYFHKDNPDTLAYSTPTYGYGVAVTTSLPKGTPIEWDKMKLSGSGTAAQNKAVATLVFALGASAGLTYGSSTSGHNFREGHWNMADALKGQFFLDYKYKGKWQASQQEWETTIYNNLKTRRPMLYSGVHPDNGGHSVVLDGYQASTGLFHFNFGWGGQSDGWYTVDDATGMNGFKDSQDLVYDITPMHPNVSCELQVGQLYHRAPSTVKVKVKNNGTLDYSGLYLYVNSSAKLPTNPIASNTTREVAPDGSAEVEISFVPILQNSKYLFLCNKNKEILDSCSISITPTASALTLNSIGVDAGTEHTEVDGMVFKTVNNTTARINVNLTNGEGGTYCRPSLECFLESYDQQQKSWKMLKNQAMNTLVFNEGESRDTLFSFAGLTPGTLYRAYLNHKVTTTSAETMAFATADSIAYFTVREPQFSATTTDRTAIVTGLWDATLFQQLGSNERICSYDITNLQQIDGSLLRTANANALFYTDNERPELATTPNVIINGECQELHISSGADFKPAKPFTARHATYTIARATMGHWVGTLIPFAAQVPLGIQMKEASSTMGNSVYHTHVTELKAMTPVLCLTSRDALNQIEASNVEVTTDSVVSLFNGVLTASTLSTSIESNWLLPGEYLNVAYFLPAGEQTEAEAFLPVITKTASRAATTTEGSADIGYRDLCGVINQAYEALAIAPGAARQAIEALQQAIGQSEWMLTNRTSTVKNDIDNEAEALRQAIADFLNAVATGISSPRTTNGLAPAPAEYYTLSGTRIDQPRRGIVIVHQGNKTKKVIIK